MIAVMLSVAKHLHGYAEPSPPPPGYYLEPDHLFIYVSCAKPGRCEGDIFLNAYLIKSTVPFRVLFGFLKLQTQV